MKVRRSRCPVRVRGPAGPSARGGYLLRLSKGQGVLKGDVADLVTLLTHERVKEAYLGG